MTNLRQKLRPYQEAHLQHAQPALFNGKNPVISLFTGAGKTFLGLAIIEPVAVSSLWLADTTALVLQNASEAILQGIPIARDTWLKLRRHVIKRKLEGGPLDKALKRRSIESKNYKGGLECRTYAWIATQYRNKGPQWLAGRWAYIVCDEADLALAEKWSRAIDAVNASLLGLTATPFRHDGKPLGALFGDLVRLTPAELREIGLPSEPDARCLTVCDGIELTWLTDCRVFRVTFEEFGTNSRSYINTHDHREEVWKRWAELGRDRITIVVLDDIASANDFAATGNAMFGEGTAKAVHMKSEATLSDFKAGQFQVACTVAMAYRGINHPPVSALVFCVDAKSLARQFQFMGRGLRRSDDTGKTDCMLLVAGDAYDDLPLTLFDSIQGKIEEPETLTERTGKLLGDDDAPGDQMELPTVTDIISRLERIRLWRKRVASCKTMAWLAVDKSAVLCLRAPGDSEHHRRYGEYLEVRLSSWSDAVCIVRHLWHSKSGKPQLKVVTANVDEPTAYSVAEGYATSLGFVDVELDDARKAVRRWHKYAKPAEGGVVVDLFRHWLWQSRYDGDAAKAAKELAAWHAGQGVVDASLAEAARRDKPVPRTHGEAVHRHRTLIARGELNPQRGSKQ